MIFVYFLLLAGHLHILKGYGAVSVKPEQKSEMHYERNAQEETSKKTGRKGSELRARVDSGMDT